MKDKSIIILGGLIAVCVLYLVISPFSRQINYKLPAWFDVNEKEITQITVKRPSGTVEFKKAGEDWRIFPLDRRANNGLVQRIVNGITGSKITDLASDKNNPGAFGLGEAERMVVEWTDNKGTHRFFVGNTGTGGRSTFIQFEKSQKIYAIQYDFVHEIDREVSVFRNNVVASFDMEDFKSVTIDYAGKQLEITKEAGKIENPWICSRPGADPEVLNKVMEKLAELSCESYINTSIPKQTEFQITVNAKTVNTVRIFKTDEYNSYGISDISEDPFILTNFLRDNIKKLFGE
jgi:hypothetical protein